MPKKSAAQAMDRSLPQTTHEGEWVVYLRLPADYQARVDEHAERLRVETGMRVNQADALRSVMRLGICVAEDDDLRTETERRIVSRGRERRERELAAKEAAKRARP